MKQRIISIAAALALCLSLLPGTAWAAEGDAGAVTITNEDGSSSVTMEAGIKYEALSWMHYGGIKKLEDQENPDGSAYLVYADGVLTAYGSSNYNDYPFVTGTMSIASDLTIKMEGTIGENSRVGLHRVNAPALVLNDHTLTLSDGVRLEVSSQTADPEGQGPVIDSCAVENGTIVGQDDVRLEISGFSAVAAVKDLTIQNVPNVLITGTTASGGVVENLTLVNCGAEILQNREGNDTIVDAGQITTDSPVFLGTRREGNYHTEIITQTGLVTEDGKIWNYGGDISSTLNNGRYMINSADPIVYEAGEGKVFYEPAAEEGGTAVLTLDGASFAGGTVFIPVSSLSDSIKPLRLELKGDNRIKDIFAPAHLTLTGTGSFEGCISTAEFTKNSTGTLNAVVGVFGQGDINTYTVYGEVSTSGRIFSPTVRTPLTIAEGAVLTVDEEDGIYLDNTDGVSLINNGTIINNGNILILTEENAQDADISEYIKSLQLTGTGSVEVGKGHIQPGAPTDTYTNSGTKLLDPAGALDLSSADTDDTSNWTTQGYKWEVTKETNSSGNEIITSAKLTLAPGFNAEEVTLPDATVTIETTGESSIGTLTTAAREASQSPHIQLTFSGSGKLTLQKRLGLDGNTSDLTISQGAHVIAEEGIVSGDSGGHSSVTVNGTLEAKSYNDGTYDNPALSTGKVAVGNTGVLEVSGTEGVLLNGVGGNSSDHETDVPLTDMFTVKGDGRFTANCSKYNVRVGTNNGVIPQGTTAEGAIPLGDEYMPDDCAVKIQDNGTIDLVKKGTSNVYTDALTIHKNHQAASTWERNATHHWHPCIYPGCDWKDSEAPHYYAHGAEQCRDCKYPRPAGTPDSDGGSSGGGGGGTSRYAVTVEKASHGEVTSSRRTASRGDTVTLTVTPDSGYALNTLTVTDSRGNEIALTEKGGGAYTFTMPSRAVTVEAAFLPLPDDTNKPCNGGADCPSRAFSDLDTSKWYHEAVDHVLRNNLMCGYGGGLFGPDDNLTRAQFAQILYNKEGRPAVNYLLQYSDVADGAWYTEAVRWAASQGIVHGYGNGMFGPNDNITREQLAVMLWRHAGSPAVTEKELHFTDADKVSGYALDALQWAVENGIISGYGNGQLAPQGLATRAQAAQMLKSYLER